jgi:hypothetical protein
MVECRVLFEVRTEFLNVIQTSWEDNWKLLEHTRTIWKSPHVCCRCCIIVSKRTDIFTKAQALSQAVTTRPLHASGDMPKDSSHLFLRSQPLRVLAERSSAVHLSLSLPRTGQVLEATHRPLLWNYVTTHYVHFTVILTTRRMVHTPTMTGLCGTPDPG